MQPTARLTGTARLSGMHTRPRRPAYQQASLLTNPATQQRAALHVMKQLRRVPAASSIERREIARDLLGQVGHVGTRLTAAGACKALRTAGVPGPLVAFLGDDRMVDSLALSVEAWGRSWIHVPAANATLSASPSLEAVATQRAAGLRAPVGRRR